MGGRSDVGRWPRFRALHRALFHGRGPSGFNRYRGDAVTPTRPVLRWHGGKWKLAEWIIAHLPPHRVYVEPFGGAASVLIRKPRSYAEIYNDLDGDVVNLFRVLRSDDAHRLVEALRLTPFAREEFEQSYRISDDPVERARQLVIRSLMGFGSNGHNAATKTGFRAASNNSGTTPAQDWVNYPVALDTIIKRLRAVVIDSKDAVAVMQQHDGPETLHYVDPPYIWETRSKAMHRNGCYAHEMDEEQHKALLEALTNLRGMVVVSGYPHPLYDEYLRGWEIVERAAHADGAKDRVEVLWINPAASNRAQPDMFVRAA